MVRATGSATQCLSLQPSMPEGRHEHFPCDRRRRARHGRDPGAVRARLHARVRGQPDRELRPRRVPHHRCLRRLLHPVDRPSEHRGRRRDRRGGWRGRRAAAERPGDRAVQGPQRHHRLDRDARRGPHRPERARHDLRSGQRLLLVRAGQPSPRRAVPVDHLRYRGDRLGAGRGRPHLPAAAANAFRQGDPGRFAGQGARSGERHPRAANHHGDLGAGRRLGRLRGLRARRHDRHLRSPPRLQLPSAHHHRHRGRGPRAAVRDPRRRPHRRARDSGCRRVHQFGVRTGLCLPAPGTAHAVPAERRVRPAEFSNSAGLMYWVSVVTEAGIFAILALGLDVVWGWSGDFDLMFYGYLALGSYMTFVLTIGKPPPSVEYIIGWHLPVVLSMVLAIAAVVALAAIIGAIALRNLREIYFAVTTLGAVSALYLLVEIYTPLFDGYNGVYGLINPGQTALNLTYNGYRIVFLAVVLVLLALIYLLVERLSASPFGRMLRSVREDEHAAAAYGRSVFWAKYRAYLFGAALAGLAGGLFAVFISAFNPSAWTPQELLVIYAAILVGGRGNPRSEEHTSE